MSYYDRLISEFRNLVRRSLGDMLRVGTVKQVKGDKLRMVLGKDENGEEVLSPWLHTANHRGGSRERRFYKEGQSLALLSPAGDIRQGMMLPWAPSKDFMSPDHANKSGQDEDVYQLEDLRVRKTKEGYEIWLQKPQKQQQQQGDLKQMPERQGDGEGQAEMKVKINRNGGITGRVGKNRFMAHQKGVKLKAGNDFAVVQPGKLIVSREWEIGKDPLPDDDK